MMEESLPPGFRFHPTDEELITHYLTPKVCDISFTSIAIADVDLNKCEPWDLPGKASMGEKEWYFFSLRDRKYPTGLRTNRATQTGYWKTTGKDKEIYRGGSLLVGMKKTLVFYRGRAPKGEKTNWVMHEYRLENKHSFKSTKEEWVVCRVFQKSIVMKKPPSLEQSPCDKNDVRDMEVNVGNSSSTDMIASAQHYSTNGQNHNSFGNMNWQGAPSLSPLYPLACSNNNLLGSNLAVNSLLVKALQLRAREADYGRYLETQGMSNFGIMTCDQSSNFEASSSQTHQEQPFHLDSIW